MKKVIKKKVVVSICPISDYSAQLVKNTGQIKKLPLRIETFGNFPRERVGFVTVGSSGPSGEGGDC